MYIVTDEKILRKECKEIGKKDTALYLNNLVNEMKKLMFEKQGVGIAAPQVGVNKRLFLALLEEGKRLELFINPIILEHSEEMIEGTEGCLSVPNCYGTVSRHETITIQYCNGQKVITEIFTGFNAVVIQHEYDHLEGILYTDKATDIQKKELDIAQ